MKSIKIFSDTNEDLVNLRCLRSAVIGIEGLIGSGKTTLGTSLKYQLKSIGFKNVKFFKEYVNTDLLNQYLSDIEKYSYTFQIIMLIKRLEIYKKAIKYSESGGISIIDRTLPGDYAFALMQYKSGNIDESEWNIYNSILQQHKRIKPSIILYLKTDINIALNRMIHRGRVSEVNGYDIKYFEDLESSYNEVFKNVNTKTLNINWNDNLTIKDNLLRTNDCTKILYNIKDALM